MSTSAAAAVNAALAAAAPEIEPPAHVRLREKDRLFWSDIVRSRARDEWARADLVVAAQLARCQADIEAEAETLEAEGSVVENGRGTPVMNPRHAVLEQLSRRELALMRALQMAGATLGNKDDRTQARKLQRQAESVREELAEDDLLAT